MKEVKFTVRMSQEEYDLLKKSANLDKRTTTDFIRSSALTSAEQIIKEKGEQPTMAEIKTVKRDYEAERGSFVKRPLEEETKAFNTLSHPALGIYLYLTREKNASLTYEVISEHCPMTKDTYTKAVQELIRKGYLHRQQEAKDGFIFFSNPFFPADDNI